MVHDSNNHDDDGADALSSIRSPNFQQEPDLTSTPLPSFERTSNNGEQEKVEDMANNISKTSNKKSKKGSNSRKKASTAKNQPPASKSSPINKEKKKHIIADSNASSSQPATPNLDCSPEQHNIDHNGADKLEDHKRQKKPKKRKSKEKSGKTVAAPQLQLAGPSLPSTHSQQVASNESANNIKGTNGAKKKRRSKEKAAKGSREAGDLEDQDAVDASQPVSTSNATSSSRRRRRRRRYQLDEDDDEDDEDSNEEESVVLPGAVPVPGLNRPGGRSTTSITIADDNTDIQGAVQPQSVSALRLLLDAELAPAVVEPAPDMDKEVNVVLQKRRRRWLCMSMLVLVPALIVTVVLLTRSPSAPPPAPPVAPATNGLTTPSPVVAPTEESTVSPTNRPTPSPSSAPSKSTTTKMLDVILETIYKDETTVSFPSSLHQQSAWDWLVADSRAISMVESNPDLMTERFLLALFYYATSGSGSNSWNSQTLWLSSQSVCAWEHIRCNSLGQVTDLVLDTNGLVGNIPTELGLLSVLQELDLSRNALAGNIPSTLGTLVELTALRLTDNQLTGTIPSTLGLLTKLELLYIGDNNLRGTIPSEVTDLTSTGSLIFFFYDGNCDVEPYFYNDC